MKARLFSFIVILGIINFGCQTISSEQKAREEAEEAEKNLGVVAGALTGKNLSEQELKDLEKKITVDPKAKSEK